MKATRKSKPKHVPQRTCIACREITPKRELIRLICNAGGIIEIDPSGEKAGRGAYLCYDPVCWENGLKKGRLARALRTRINLESQLQLIEFSKTLSRSKEARS